jgi:hypothetical protein
MTMCARTPKPKQPQNETMTSSSGYVNDLDSSFQSPQYQTQVAQLTDAVGNALFSDPTFVDAIASQVATKLLQSAKFQAALSDSIVESGLLKDCVTRDQLQHLLHSDAFVDAVGVAINEKNGVAYDDSGVRIESQPHAAVPVPRVYVLVNEQPADKWIKIAAGRLLEVVGYSGPPVFYLDSAEQLIAMQSDANATPAVLLYMVNCSTERLDAFIKFGKLDLAMTAPLLNATVVIGVRSMSQRAKMTPIVSDIDPKAPSVAGRGISHGTCFFYASTQELFEHESRSAIDVVRQHVVPPSSPPKSKERRGFFNSMKTFLS